MNLYNDRQKLVRYSYSTDTNVKTLVFFSHTILRTFQFIRERELSLQQISKYYFELFDLSQTFFVVFKFIWKIERTCFWLNRPCCVWVLYTNHITYTHICVIVFISIIRHHIISDKHTLYVHSFCLSYLIDPRSNFYHHHYYIVFPHINVNSNISYIFFLFFW